MLLLRLALGLRPHEAASGGCDASRHKPHPEPLLLALEKLQVAPQHAVYVGDRRCRLLQPAHPLSGARCREGLELEKPDVLAHRRELLEIFPAR